MTKAELKAIWARYAHRADLDADLDEVFRAAEQRILGRLMRADTSLADLLADSPSLHVHAGLISIHELSQDDEGIARETALFEVAAQNYAHERSRVVRPGPPVMGVS